MGGFRAFAALRLNARKDRLPALPLPENCPILAEQSVRQGWGINSRRTLSRGDHPQPFCEFPKSPVASPFLPTVLQNPLDPAVIPDPRVLVIALATVSLRWVLCVEFLHELRVVPGAEFRETSLLDCREHVLPDEPRPVHLLEDHLADLLCRITARLHGNNRDIRAGSLLRGDGHESDLEAEGRVLNLVVGDRKSVV